MRAKTLGLFSGVIWLILNTLGCSTTDLVPYSAPTPPVYTQVPHPAGMELGDLVTIFNHEKAPVAKDFSKTCDGNFRNLEKATNSRSELIEGLRELVKQDPVFYHWCFYGKLLSLENELKGDLFIDEKQKVILETFAFLAPLAHTFSIEYHDSRYLRAAVYRYQRWSERVFFRKLELSPVGTSELVKASNPFGLWKDTLETVSVLEKYHINHDGSEPIPSSNAAPPSSPTPVLNSEPMASPIPTAALSPSPNPSLSPNLAAEPSPVPSPTPSIAPTPPALPSPSPSPKIVPPPTVVSSPVPAPKVEQAKASKKPGSPEDETVPLNLPIEGAE